jgi:lipid A 3-O-deacylase
MSKISPKIIRNSAIASLTLFALAGQGSALAESDWKSFTMDNDSLVGTDNGYTNGFYYSWFDTMANNKPEIGFLARTMAWSLPNSGQSDLAASIGTIGQTMMTPDDIKLKNPPEDDLPYAGLLFYNDTYVERFSGGYADRISATIGIIGEYSFAEEMQTFVHEILDGDEPEGWDTQLDSEIVFQFSRGRVWQSWKASSGKQDLLLGADGALGTISSSASTSIMWRYGEQLDRSYATTLLSSGRTTNPVAVDTSWYWFAGAAARYTANSIFLDGNTYEDSREVEDWDNEQVAVTFGLAYSWKDWSLTYAINDLNVIGDNDNDAVDEYTQYGTITVAWRGD